MFERRYVVETGRRNAVQVVMAGCGGTGSFLALHLARMAHHARDRGVDVRLTFVDPDRVEVKNLGRQNFCGAEVGRNKAECLMERYNLAFGLQIEAHGEPFCKAHFPDWTDRRERLVAICGCVDNAEARRQIQAYVSTANGGLWWIDGGNHDHSGQVLIGNRTDITAPEIVPLGVCAGLPAPGIQHPELLADAPRAVGAPSCADLTLADVQGLMVNQAVAGWMATYVYRLALAHDLDVYQTYFDLAAGSARSTPIVEE